VTRTVVIASNGKIGMQLDYKPKLEIRQAKDVILNLANDRIICSSFNFHFNPDKIKRNKANAGLEHKVTRHD
jgi:hypothetical protein